MKMKMGRGVKTTTRTMETTPDRSRELREEGSRKKREEQSRAEKFQTADLHVRIPWNVLKYRKMKIGERNRELKEGSRKKQEEQSRAEKT